MTEAAPAVYPGCAVPSLKPSHHTFYVDPINGSATGDGSATKPWKSLAAVLDSSGKILSTQVHKKPGGVDPLTVPNPNGPVKSGDVIMLMSGNHGDVTLQNAFNTDFITVMAAPGQTPVISRMKEMSASNWMFQGIKFQGKDPSPTPASIAARDGLDLVSIGLNEWQGTSSNIIISDSSFSTTDDVKGWSDTDWLLKPYSYALDIKQGSCISVVNNSFYNVLNALFQNGNKSLTQSNTFDAFSNDAIEITSGNSIIRANTIKNGIGTTSVSPWHADGIQGWSLGGSKPILNQNVLIDGNKITKTGNPNIWMQGISIYDGKWKGLTIQNNAVVVNTYHGIAVYGGEDVKIVNNTVLASDPASRSTWIRVSQGKDGTHSKNVVVRNNITNMLMIEDTGTTFDHNAIGGAYPVVLNGKTNMIKANDYTNKNQIYSNLTSNFVQVDNKSGSYDLRLKNGAIEVEPGNASLAPKTDITGKDRKTPVDLGAYSR